jgi:hypothetical protein
MMARWRRCAQRCAGAWAGACGWRAGAPAATRRGCCRAATCSGWWASRCRRSRCWWCPARGEGGGGGGWRRSSICATGKAAALRGDVAWSWPGPRLRKPVARPCWAGAKAAGCPKRCGSTWAIRTVWGQCVITHRSSLIRYHQPAGQPAGPTGTGAAAPLAAPCLRRSPAGCELTRRMMQATPAPARQGASARDKRGWKRCNRWSCLCHHRLLEAGGLVSSAAVPCKQRLSKFRSKVDAPAKGGDSTR